MTSTKFWFESGGDWSGGGRAFLNNASLAEKMYPLLFSRTEGAVPIIPRNRPVAMNMRRSAFILAPQNAWPHGPSHATGIEWARWAALRFESNRWRGRAAAILRISEAIPLGPAATSKVIHNVLDDSFERALQGVEPGEFAERARGQFVSIGSFTGYRNFQRLVRGFREYRQAGGSRELHLAGGPSVRVATQLQSLMDGIDGLVVHSGRYERSQCLAALRMAHGVVLPSLIEASPFSLLEAVAMNSNVACADIEANRGICRSLPNSLLWFAPRDVLGIRDALIKMDHGPADDRAHRMLSDPEYRAIQREAWVHSVAGWLQELDIWRNE